MGVFFKGLMMERVFEVMENWCGNGNFLVEMCFFFGKNLFQGLSMNMNMNGVISHPLENYLAPKLEGLGRSIFVFFVLIYEMDIGADFFGDSCISFGSLGRVSTPHWILFRGIPPGRH